MDFLGRLTNIARHRSRAQVKSELLEQFEASWRTIYRIFFVDNRHIEGSVDVTPIPNCLQTMVDCLVREQSLTEEAELGGCMEFLLKSEVIQTLCDVSSADFPSGMMGETLKMFSNLVSMMDKQFLVPYPVHRPLLTFLHACIQERQQSRNYEEAMVDLMYGICAKIRSYPDLLNLFFTFNRSPTPNGGPGTPSARSVRSRPVTPSIAGDDEFSLFTYLLRFVHREGNVGDYARTGLLLLLELDGERLQQFVFRNNDFPVILAAGLGAVFSQLPRQLDRVVSPTVSIPNSLIDLERNTRNDPLVEEVNRVFNLTDYSADELGSLLKMLTFCDDVIKLARDHRVIESITGQIRNVFLQNVVYPSVSTASEADGSITAMNFYCLCMMRSLHSQEMKNSFARFLLGPAAQSSFKLSPEGFDTTPKSQDQRQSIRPILLKRLRSEKECIIRSTFKLISTVLETCPEALCYAFDSIPQMDLKFLLAVSPKSLFKSKVCQRYRICERFFSLLPAQRLDAISIDYDAYVSYAETTIGRQILISPKNVNDVTSDNSFEANILGDDDEDDLDVSMEYEAEGGSLAQTLAEDELRILGNDPLLCTLFCVLKSFFSHKFETNLVLTGLIATLLTHAHPIVFSYLLNADLLLSSSSPSLYTIFLYLNETKSKEITLRKAVFDDFDRLSWTVRSQGLIGIHSQSVPEFCHQQSRGRSAVELHQKPSPTNLERLKILFPGAVPSDAEAQAITGFHSSPNLVTSPRSPHELQQLSSEDRNFVYNVVIFEECVKEILAILQVQTALQPMIEVNFME